jgi:hypothetical protein
MNEENNNNNNVAQVPNAIVNPDALAPHEPGLPEEVQKLK